MTDDLMDVSKLRVRLAEMPARYRDATVLLAGTCALIAGAITSGLSREILGLWPSMVLSGLAFLGAGYIAAWVFRFAIGSISSEAQGTASVEEAQATVSDFIDQTSVLIRRGVFGLVGVVCLVAAATNLRAIFIGKFDPQTLLAVAGTASWSVVAFVAAVSLSLVHRRDLALALIIGNLFCLLLALVSFAIRPSPLAIVVIVWCAALVILPLLKMNLWWKED